MAEYATSNCCNSAAYICSEGATPAALKRGNHDCATSNQDVHLLGTKVLSSLPDHCYHPPPPHHLLPEQRPTKSLPEQTRTAPGQLWLMAQYSP